MREPWTPGTFRRNISNLNAWLAFACLELRYPMTTKFLRPEAHTLFQLVWAEYRGNSPGLKGPRIEGCPAKAADTRSASNPAPFKPDTSPGAVSQTSTPSGVNERHERWIETAAEIVGREELAGEIHRLLLEDCRENMLLIHGEPGIGKTGLMQKYIQQHTDCLWHFIERTQGTKAEDCLRDLCKQLVKRYGLQEELRAEEDLYTLRAQFQRLLRLVSKSAGAGRVEIVIDGLDELPADRLDRLHNPLGIEDRAIPGVYFLFSARHPNSLPLNSIRRRKIEPSETDQGKAIRKFIRQQCDPEALKLCSPIKELEKRQKQAVKRLERLAKAHMSVDDFANQLGPSAGWNFMYVYCVLSELGLNQDIDIQDLLRRLPPSLIPYYENHWRRMWERKQQNKPLLIIFHALCAGGKVGRWRRSWLAALAKVEPAEVNEILDGPWAMFIRYDDSDGQRPRCRFYHDSYREFMKEADMVKSTYESFGLSFEKLDAALPDKLMGLVLKEQGQEG
jgi:hypothetical protein